MSDELISKKKIGRYTYCVRKLTVFEGTDLVHELAESLGPAFGGLMGGALQAKADAQEILDGMSKEDAAKMASHIQSGIESIFRTTTKERQRAWITKMRDCSFVEMGDGTTPELSKQFDAIFQGHLGEMYQWLFFALRSQCDDFFDGPNGGIVSAVRAMKAMA